DMQRWHSKRLRAAIAAAVSVFSLSAWSTFAAERPNIVVYLSDDHSQFDSSLYGNDNIPTPNFEKLAADGMTFTHAFVASPSCAPSRAALLTGLMPARNGAEANHTKPKDGTHWLVQDLKAAGYEVVAFGKVAHGTYTNEPGFDQVNTAAAVEALRSNVSKFLAARRSDKPLCLFVGTSNPHVPWAEESTFDPAEVEFPPHHLDTPATRVHRAAYYQEIKDLDRLMGELREMAGEHLGENTVFIHTSDHGSQWPFGKWNLYDYGIRVPLIAAWPGVIQPGVTSDAMVSWADLLPTLIDIAGGRVPAGIDGRSFLPVLRGAEAQHRDAIFTTHTGDGRMNIYPIRSVRTRDWKLIHNLHPEFAHTNHSDLDRKPLAGAYWGEWAALAKTDESARRIVDRYFRRPEWELYHVSDYKWELNNLVEDPAQAKRIEEMKKQLADWMREQGDAQLVHSQPRLLSEPAEWHPDHFRGGSANKPKNKRK
ncbi:MAG: sulfatase, partial [Planctomycetota bacterium]